MHLLKLERSFKLIFLFILLRTAPFYGQEQLFFDNYQITIDKDSPKIAHVQAIIEVQDSLLYMSGIGANQFPSRWAHFVHHLKAKTLSENPIEIDSLAGAKWRIYSPNGSKIKLSYTVHLDHENFKWNGGVDGAAYAREWGVFYTGRSIFIMSGKQKKNIEVHFKID
jgi:hypothetical protein